MSRIGNWLSTAEGGVIVHYTDTRRLRRGKVSILGGLGNVASHRDNAIHLQAQWVRQPPTAVKCIHVRAWYTQARHRGHVEGMGCGMHRFRRDDARATQHL